MDGLSRKLKTHIGQKEKNQNHLWSNHQRALLLPLPFQSFLEAMYQVRMVQSFRPQALEPLCKSVARIEGFCFLSTEKDSKRKPLMVKSLGTSLIVSSG